MLLSWVDSLRSHRVLRLSQVQSDGPDRVLTGAGRYTHLSKMAPTPALWALFLCTCSPVASKIPSFTEMERWEKEAIRSSFQPVGSVSQ